jgi:hypothetical protein
MGACQRPSVYRPLDEAKVNRMGHRRRPEMALLVGVKPAERAD